MWSGEDLELVDAALRRLLKQEADGSQGEEVNDGVLRKLIEEVHVLKLEKAPESRCDDDTKEKASNEVDSVSIAVKAALAAANAAQAAADSVAKTSRIIELVLETMQSHRRKETEETEGEALELSAKKAAKLSKLVKDVRRQNIVTHCILGVMVLATALWRFKEISWILKLRKVLNNPLEAVKMGNPLDGVFGGEHQHHEHKEEVETKMQLPHIELPHIFQKTETTSNISP